jgi:hypothetical protein
MKIFMLLVTIFAAEIGQRREHPANVFRDAMKTGVDV